MISANLYVQALCPRLHKIAEKIRIENQNFGNLSIEDALTLIAERIGFEFDTSNSVISTLDRAEEFLREKQK